MTHTQRWRAFAVGLVITPTVGIVGYLLAVAMPNIIATVIVGFVAGVLLAITLAATVIAALPPNHRGGLG